VHAGTADADLHLVGDAVELTEALSLRRPLDAPSATGATGSSWMLSGLLEAFDR
jgi:galactokinase/mevalonate kinase-like predicted kinase